MENAEIGNTTQESVMAITLHSENPEDFSSGLDDVARKANLPAHACISATITSRSENPEDFLAAYDEAALRKKAAEEEVAKANAELNEIHGKARAAAISKFKDAIAEFGIEPRDLFEDIQIVVKKKQESEKRGYTPPTAKYRGPNGEEWSGRGLTPRWLSALIAAGRTKEEFAIAAQ